MKKNQARVAFPGKVVILGFGSIGQALLPLLLREIDLQPSQVTVIAKDEDGIEIARQYGVRHEVESLALMKYCHGRRILYIDTVTEPWPGRSDDPAISPSRRSNYALREEALAFGRQKPNGPTAVITMGANPGLASAWVKQALMNLAADRGLEIHKPSKAQDWARLARRLGIKVIHVAERDTQVAKERKRRGEFVNTWSVIGFVCEGLQPAELVWGTHERHLPHDGRRHAFGSDAAILLERPGSATRVRSWTPLEGPYHGFLITHAESISIADYLTLREATGEVAYRPTVHYAYHPSDDAVLSLHELAGNDWRLQQKERIIGPEEIVDGMDELGVLLMSAKKGVYWYGSRLTIDQARKIAPHNSATSLQVVGGLVAGIVWAIRNPSEGVVEPEHLDHEMVLEIARPYLGEVVGVYGEWNPIKGRSDLFSTDMDSDPWQFKNFRVT